VKEYNPRDRIESARMTLVLEFPFYGSVFLRMTIIEDDTCRTAWTDGVCIGYNVAYLSTLTDLQIIGVFVHEVLHVMLKHHLRETTNPEYRKQHDRWNRACDYALNPMIKHAAGMDIHKSWLYEPKWDDDLAEHIFDQIPAKDPNAGDGMPGEVRPWPGNKPKPGEPKQAPTASDVDAQAQKVDQWIASASFKAQGAGKLSDAEKGFIRTATASTVNWTDELQFLMQEICENDYTWQRPNTRYMSDGIYMPTMSGVKTSDLLFFVDRSGSLNTAQLQKIAAEIRDIVSEFDIRVIVVYWDTEFQGMEVFDADDVLEPTWKLDIDGRGGTNFSGCWNWLENNDADFDFDPAGIVFFTDLECRYYPAVEPDVPVIWCQVPDCQGNFEHSFLQFMPDYGKRVLIPVFRGAECCTN
jgi:predicted metal-dependent peptidase